MFNTINRVRIYEAALKREGLEQMEEISKWTLKMDSEENLEKRNMHDVDVATNIFVRAKNEKGKWVNCDIALLDKESLLIWLKSRGGDNPWAEDVVGMLLGHGHLHKVDS